MPEELSDYEVEAMRAYSGGPVAEQINARLGLGEYGSGQPTRNRRAGSQVVTAPRAMTEMDHWLRAQTTKEPQLTLRQRLPLIAGWEVGELPAT
jgi:hypothetical protein